MLKRRTKILLILSLIVIASFPASWNVIAQTTETEQTTLVLGDISDNPAKKIKQMQPLADMLASELTDYGITSGEVKIAPDMETMMGWIADGEVDLYFDSLFPAIMIMQETGAEPILTRWKDGLEEYNSVIFALKTSGFETVDDLQGEMVAYDSPDSTSGYLLPTALLMELGFNLTEKPSASASVADDEIGYVFSGDDENSVQWLISGRVSAAVIDSGGFMELPEEAHDHLVILGETRFVPRQVALLNAEFDPDIKEAMIAIMLELRSLRYFPPYVFTVMYRNLT